MDVFALNLRLKEEGAASVETAVKKLKGSFDQAAKGAGGLDGALAGLKSKLIGLATVGTAVTIIKKIADESSKAQFAQAQLENAVRVTGMAAGQSVEALNAHADALERVSIFGGDEIAKAQARLLTYTNIVGEMFPKATQLVADYAAAFDMDLVAASEAVGKALNYPSVGMAALAKQGFVYTESQKAVIKEMETTGRLAEAQAFIFEDLRSVTEGQARAARETLGGALIALKGAFEGLFETTEQGSRGIVFLINRLTDFLLKYKGALDVFVTNFAIGMVRIKAELRSFDYDLQKALVNIPAFLINLLRPLEKLPLIGDKFKSVIDGMQAPLKRVWDSADANQKKWREWEQQQYRSLTATKELRKAAIATAEATGGAGGGVGAATPRTLGALTMPTIGMTERVLPPEITPISPAVLDRVKQSTKVAIDQAKVTMMEQMEQAAAEFSASVANTLVGSLAAGIETAVATGSIGEGFKALGQTLLSGLGSALIMFGTQAIIASQLMQRFMEAMASMNPFAALAAGIGMVALGAALKGAASRAFGGQQGGAGGGSQFMTGGRLGSLGTGMQAPVVGFGATMAGAAAGSVSAAQSINITVIGPNDPQAQRQIAHLIDNAARRGLMQGGGMRV